MSTEVEGLLIAGQTWNQIWDSVPWPIVVCDDLGEVRHANQEARLLLDRFETNNLQDWIDPADQPRMLETLAECFCNSDDALEQKEIVCSPSSLFESVASIKFQFRRFSACMNDSVAAFIALECGEKVIREQQRLMNALLDNTGAVVYVKNRDGVYQYVNHLFESLFRLPQQDIIGSTDFDIFEHEVAQRFRENDERIMASKKTQRTQEYAPHEDGMHTYVSVKFPLYDLSGNVNGIGGISTDISEQCHNREELEAAQAVQRLLYPRKAPTHHGYEISGAVAAAEKVSGDYYDYIQIDDHRVVVAVGDVSGHGLGPALEMVEVRSYLRAIFRTEQNLEQVMNCLNEFLCRDLRECAFVSLFLAEFDFRTNQYNYVAAGHLGLHFRKTGEPVLLPSTGLLLGIDPNAKYVASPWINLQQSDAVVLATDGIWEAQNESGKIFGRDGVIEWIQANYELSAEAAVQGILSTSCKYSRGGMPADDMTAVMIKRLKTQE